jgi:hypothetical protein
MAFTVTAMFAEAEDPPPVPVMPTWYVPVEVLVDAEKVNVVLHVAVHVVEEKDAVIPAGNDEAVNDTAMGLPVTSVAVTVLAFDCPCAMDTLEDAAEREKLAPPRLAAVVNV